MAFAAMNGIMAFILYTALKKENARRERIYGPAPGRDEIPDFDSEEAKRRWGQEGMTRDQIVDLGDNHPAYRYML